MAVELYEHNLEAYEAARVMLDKTGKAFIVHPTGTGKSFIGFRLAEDNPDKRVLWLTPSEYIVKTQLENLKREGGAELDNITFATYAKLIMMSDEELSELKPDIGIIDEGHRTGAKRWLEGFKRLTAMYPDMKLLGLSATHIRYLDNQRDMAKELFDGHIASQMTLGEAIVRGILLPPEYIISVYGYERKLVEYEDRIKTIRNEGVRRQNQRELDKLRRALEASEGLHEVFRKHMKNRSGKYIVFCSNRNHLDEMVSHAYEWFSGVDPDMHIYTVYSEDPTASREFIDFKEDDSNNLKLLYCIDMLNEGVHVNDIDGVVMFRPTISPIIYKQQIGRALSASKKHKPIIFDVVNNFENLYSISTIQEEINLAVSYYRSLGQEDKIKYDSFEITDEVRDCRTLFEALESSLSSTWDIYFEAAKKYYKENGNLRIPKRYVTEDGLTLGLWLQTQKRVRNGTVNGYLPQERIDKLDSIGMVWENIAELRWETGFEHAKEYADKHGELNVPTKYESEDGFKLGAWIANNRTWYKNNSHTELLNNDRVKRLESIGMVWSVNNAAWEKNYLAAAEYFRTHGDLKAPYNFVTKDGIRLGSWILRQRRDYGKKLTQEQAERLEMIGMEWKGSFESKWMQTYKEACEYYNEHGSLDPPLKYRTKSGTALRAWINAQRDNTKLSKKRRALLDKIGMQWNIDPWGKRYVLAKEYYAGHGDLDIPSGYKTKDNIWLGKWLYEQRKHKEELTPKQIRLLDELGMQWESTADSAWNAQYDAAKALYDKYGKLRAADERLPQTTKLWLSKMRGLYLSGKKLTAAQRKKLEAIDITNVVENADDAWLKKLEAAKAYYKLHGTLVIPSDYTTGDGVWLGGWITRQRALYKKGKLTEKQIKLLEDAGMDWRSAAEMMWDDKYKIALDFYNTNGHLKIPANYSKTHNCDLYSWFYEQNRKYKAGEMQQPQMGRFEMLLRKAGRI